MDAAQTDEVVTILFCNQCGKVVKVHVGDKMKTKCPYCKEVMQDKNIPRWNELDIVEKENLIFDWKQQAKESNQLDEELFRRRKRSRIIRQNLKRMGIYAASICTAVLIISFCRLCGLILGGIPSAIICLIAFFIARIMAK